MDEVRSGESVEEDGRNSEREKTTTRLYQVFQFTSKVHNKKMSND